MKFAARQSEPWKINKIKLGIGEINKFIRIKELVKKGGGLGDIYSGVKFTSANSNKNILIVSDSRGLQMTDKGDLFKKYLMCTNNVSDTIIITGNTSANKKCFVLMKFSM